MAPTEELVTEKVTTDQGDHDTFSHYVPTAKILESAVTGKPAIALCGKVWTPTKDGQKYPVCEQCKAVYEKLSAE